MLVFQQFKQKEGEIEKVFPLFFALNMLFVIPLHRSEIVLGTTNDLI